MLVGTHYYMDQCFSCFFSYYVKPSQSAQWIVNMNTAFAFMRDVEWMSLVNIGESQCVWVLLFILHNMVSWSMLVLCVRW